MENSREKRAKVTISGFAGILYLTNKHRTERASARRSYQITGKRRNQKTPGKPRGRHPNRIEYPTADTELKPDIIKKTRRSQ